MVDSIINASELGFTAEQKVVVREHLQRMMLVLQGVINNPDTLTKYEINAREPTSDWQFTMYQMVLILNDHILLPPDSPQQ